MVDIGGVGSPMAAGAAAGAAIGASMATFARAAASGAFAVSPTGGDALLRAIDDMRARIQEIQGDVQIATVQPQLGQSHGANVMTMVDVAVASDDQGFMPMLLKFMESLDAAEQGIRSAMANYAAMDERGAGRQQAI